MDFVSASKFALIRMVCNLQFGWDSFKIVFLASLLFEDHKTPQLLSNKSYGEVNYKEAIRQWSHLVVQMFTGFWKSAPEHLMAARV